MDAIKFILLSNLFALMAWPISYFIFRKFPDNGWSLSKILGSLLAAWFIWLTSSLHIISYSTTNSFLQIAFLFFAIILAVRFFSKVSLSEIYLNIYDNFFGKVKNYYTITAEIIFIFGFILWNQLKSTKASIFGLEKFMDHGFMVSSMKTKYFPPLDHFFANETINYYYFGHYIASLFTKLSFVTPTISYNMMMSYIAAIAMAASFSVALAIAKELKLSVTSQYASGLLSLFLVAFAGNIQYFAHLILLSINKITGSSFNTLLLDTEKSYHYPRATRYIPNTIHEFPIYSFVVNDLHAHVCNIPNVILITSLLFICFTNSFNKNLKPIKIIGFMLLISFLIGVCYATSAWDLAIYTLFLSYGCLHIFKLKNNYSGPLPYFHPRTILSCAIIVIPSVVLALIFVMPFVLNLKPPSTGIGIVPAGKGSAIHELLLICGLQWFFMACYTFYLSKIDSIGNNISTVENPEEDENPRYKLLKKFFITAGKNPELEEDENLRYKLAKKFIFTAFLTAITLTFIHEVLYLKDIYSGHFRSNTVFKLNYQFWMITGITLGPVIVLSWKLVGQSIKIINYGYKLITIVLLIGASTYTYIVIKDGCNLSNTNYTLNGSDFMKEKELEDLAMINWMNENIKGQPVIVESVGKSYSYNARVSSFTGFPTVLGWPVHEWLWRGPKNKSATPTSNFEKRLKIPDTIDNREKAIQEFYETDDREKARKFINDYQVEYIYLGKTERETYKGIKEDKFPQIAKLVKQEGKTLLFKTEIETQK